MNSDAVKFLISVATGLVKVTDQVGLLNVVFTAFLAKLTFSSSSTFGRWSQILAPSLDKYITQAIAAKAATQTLGASAAAAALGVNLLNAALTAGVALLAGLVIGAVVKGFYDLAHASEKVAEAANKAKDNIESISSEFKSNQKTVSDLAKRFAELAQGVDVVSGKNVSLRTDDYEEFLDISNQLADIFPTLSRHYDENGNAIVQLSGDTNTIVGSLENLLEVQRQLANQKIAENLPDFYKGIKQQSDAYNAELKLLEDQRNAYEVELNRIAKGSVQQDFFDNLLAGGTYQLRADSLDAANALLAEYQKIFNEAGEDLGIKLIAPTVQYKFDKELGQDVFDYLQLEVQGFDTSLLNIPFEELTEEEQTQVETFKQRLKDGFNDVAAEYSDGIKNLNSQIETSINKNKANWSSLYASILSWIQTDSSYKVLSDDMKSIVQTVITNLDFNSLDFSSWEQLQGYIQNQILPIFTDSTLSKDITKAFAGMFDIQSKFNGNEIPLQKYKDQIISFVDVIQNSGLDEAVQEQLLQMFNIDIDKIKNGEETLGENIDDTLNYIQSIIDEEAQKRVFELSYADLQIINSTAFTVPEGTILSWDQLQAKIQETKKALTQDFTTANFADYADSVNAIASSISTYQEALDKLGDGTFTLADFMELIKQFPNLAAGVDITSKSFDGLSVNLRRAIKNSPKSLIADLKKLRAELEEAGKSTANIDQLINAIEHMPTDSVENLVNEFGTLADKINAARVAQDNLQKAMQKNPNEGYEIRGDAIEQMKKLMEQGQIGSGSELWDIAKAYGFTYNSADTIQANATALYEYIKIRERWFKKDKEGNYTDEGITNFIKDVAEKTDILKQFKATWTFNNGELNIDLNNESWEEFAAALGLTSEEFTNMMEQIAMFFEINWDNADDVTSYISRIAEGSGTASEKIESMTDAVESYVEKALGKDIDFENLNQATIDALECDESIKQLLTTYLELRKKFEDPLNVKTTMSENGLEGLLKIEKLKKVIGQKDGITVFDEEAFKTVLQDAGYADSQITDLIAKIKEYKDVITTTPDDPLGLKSADASMGSVTTALGMLGVKYSELTDEQGTTTLDINIKDLTTVLKEKGWTTATITEYLNSLTSGENGIPITIGSKTEFTEDDVKGILSEGITAEVSLNTEEADAYFNDPKTITATVDLDTTDANAELEKLGISPERPNGNGNDDSNGTGNGDSTIDVVSAADGKVQKPPLANFISDTVDAISSASSKRDSTDLADAASAIGDSISTFVTGTITKAATFISETFDLAKNNGSNSGDTVTPEPAPPPQPQSTPPPPSTQSQFGGGQGGGEGAERSIEGIDNDYSWMTNDQFKNYIQTTDGWFEKYAYSPMGSINLTEQQKGIVDALMPEDLKEQFKDLMVEPQTMTADAQQVIVNGTVEQTGNEPPKSQSPAETPAQPEQPKVQGIDADETGSIEQATEQVNAFNQATEQAGNSATQMWMDYMQNESALAALNTIQDTTTQLTQEEAAKFGIEIDENQTITVQEAIDQLIAKKKELETPAVMRAVLECQGIDMEIQQLKEKLDLPDSELELEAYLKGISVDDLRTEIEEQIQELQTEKVLTMAGSFNIELNPEDAAEVAKKLAEIEATKFTEKNVSISMSGVDYAIKKVTELRDRINEINTDIQIDVEVNDGPNSGGDEADGTAHARGTAFKSGSWGAPKTETALVGELGPEILVRGDRWATVGENGAEFTDIRRGDIIFNHKQTRSLLENGYVTGRGKAFAEGNAFVSGSGSITKYKFSDTSGSSAKQLSKAADDLSSAADDISEDFEEIFDWIEVRIEEITETINLLGAQLENAIGSINQNAIIDDQISMNKQLYDNLIAGANEYYRFAAELLKKVPKEYRNAAQNGKIAIEYFRDKVGGEALEAIQNYREWVQKGADFTQQAEETLTEISNLAKQAIDNIASDYENKKSFPTIKMDQYEAYNSLLETGAGAESARVYEEIIKENNKNIATLQEQRNKMQAEFNKQVETGNIKKYSQNWYDAINDIAAVDTEIIELTTDTENYQDTINELHWDHFDNLISRLEAISNEADNLIDILSAKDLVDKDTAEWTDEGITSLGLYAQKLEVAEMQADKYAKEIRYLNDNWKALGYTEQEYVEKLEDLKNDQYGAIKAYNQTKDAIVDLNKERVDEIKSGIEKEIESYQKLIDAKKKELDTEKD